ncbi:sigma-70 family RNA polymerase sigma factor [Streptomyces sp. NPDC090052]|uniref:sigma-70 family RNA polymerase sigma factor n=1 Tax=unclassified Streptomyces TaxID=2593676 RepID=UPI002251A94F|nr:MULTISPECIES: sigma-70 family RNA polymerase sigma factor [unclassified Streptomyces]MCX4727681.1 sigma-70 family RNA polymerase sigma factor [Streptomyces sp. NBC_01306]WSV03105.1 sigma-70 family RNA polymerase sigma factor [Streptomyces sp. NBC_01020]WSX41135.1 sigma-70 family RNA polymerase sigma factor [Streptomyces sp. NBC_00963]WSX70890.1 sigma-70 family RNA polymerase sigma factor [Streptomyces sp. NBC_00932]
MDLVTELSPLLAAEAAAEAAASGVDPADLEQAVWVRLLEQTPAEPRRWVRSAVRAEADRARQQAGRELPYAVEPYADPEARPERAVLAAERRRAVRAAVSRTPGRCPRLLTAMLSPADPTYREIAGELGMSQGSLGPVRSRCLGCLRRMLTAEVAAGGRWGKER